jgi:hypothetical protein
MFDFLVVLPQRYFAVDAFRGLQILSIDGLLFGGRRSYLFGEKKLFLLVVGLEEGAPVLLVFLLLLVWDMLFDPFHTPPPIILQI